MNDETRLIEECVPPQHVSLRFQGPGIEHGIEFGVIQLQCRKSKCLYRMRGAMLEPLAYFRSDEHASIFCNVLDVISESFNTRKETKVDNTTAEG